MTLQLLRTQHHRAGAAAGESFLETILPEFYVQAESLRRHRHGAHVFRAPAGHIATAVGATLLSPEDVLPLMQSSAIDDDFAREVGFGQFCYHINRLCDFQDQLVAVCSAKRGTPERLRRYPNILRLCNRIPAQCEFCRTTAVCQPTLTGSTAGCSEEQKAASEATLKSLRTF